MEARAELELVLLAGLRQLGAAHGYALLAELRGRSSGEFDFAEGTAYPVLHRLDRAGLIDGEWDASGPRRRRVYRLTPAGESALTDKASSWARRSHLIQKLISHRRAEAWT